MAKEKEIRQDLLDQLDRNGTHGSFWEDLIEDYISLWRIKNELISDIEERGVSIRWQNSEDSFGYKKNDSVNNLHKTNTQMLRILDELGIEPTTKEEVDIPNEM